MFKELLNAIPCIIIELQRHIASDLPNWIADMSLLSLTTAVRWYQNTLMNDVSRETAAILQMSTIEHTIPLLPMCRQSPASLLNGFNIAVYMAECIRSHNSAARWDIGSPKKTDPYQNMPILHTREQMVYSPLHSVPMLGTSFLKRNVAEAILRENKVPGIHVHLYQAHINLWPATIASVIEGTFVAHTYNGA